MDWINGVFDRLFRPLESLDPLYSLTALSFVTGLGMVFVFRFTSDQKAIRRAKDRVQAHLLEVRLFQDQVGVVIRAYGRIVRGTATYLRHSLLPLAVMLLPLAILLGQMDLRFGRSPLHVSQLALLTARLAEGASLDQPTLRLPEGLALTAPPLRIPALHEVNWRLRANRTGEFEVKVSIGAQIYTKLIIVSERLVRAAPERSHGGILNWLLHPGEGALPNDAPLESLSVRYRPRAIEIGPWQLHWLIVFLVLAFLSAWISKVIIRVEL